MLMQINIDGLTVYEGQKLTDLTINNIILDLKNQQKIIKHILIDGSESQDLGYVIGKSVGNIEITTVSLPALVVEAIKDGYNYLPRLAEGLNRVAVFFGSGRDGEAIELFLQALQGLEWFDYLNKNINAILKNNLEILADLPDNTYLDNVLREMLQGWQNGDYLLVSDLLEYEIVPSIEKLYNNLAFIEEIIESRA